MNTQRANPIVKAILIMGLTQCGQDGDVIGFKSTLMNALGPPSPGACSLPTPAFCDTFEEDAPGGRAGPLDERVWSFSRFSHNVQDMMVRIPADTIAVDPSTLIPIPSVFPPTFCGEDFSNLLPGTDIRQCEGLDGAGNRSKQLNEVFNDAGGVAFNDMRIRQPFDFTGRTGTIVFDVDAKFNPLNLGHGWWVEIWLTEDPAPMPSHGASTVHSYPRAGVGFIFQGVNCDKMSLQNSLTGVFVTANYSLLHNYGGSDFTAECFQTADAKLNRFQLLISQSHAQLMASDSNLPGLPRVIATVDNLDLPFSRGYVHLEHVQDTANKDGDATPSQTYRWDNVGFDGPYAVTPRGYDVQEPRTAYSACPGALHTGWSLNDATNLQVEDVDLTLATRATLNFNVIAAAGDALRYQLNTGPIHTFELPSSGDTEDSAQSLRSYSVDVSPDELVPGTNNIHFAMQAADPNTTFFANVDLTVE